MLCSPRALSIRFTSSKPFVSPTLNPPFLVLMKLSDYVVKFVADLGITNVFLVTGGGAMHLNASLGAEKRIHAICNSHEQASGDLR